MYIDTIFQIMAKRLSKPPVVPVHILVPKPLHKSVLVYCARHPHPTGKKRSMREFFIEAAIEKLERENGQAA